MEVVFQKYYLHLKGQDYHLVYKIVDSLSSTLSP